MKETNIEKRIGNIFGSTGGNHAGMVYDKNYLSPTLNSMTGGCRQPMIVIDANVLRMVRTEEGKRLRKQYENHEIKHGFHEHCVYEPKWGGVSNTITSIQKDNLVIIETEDSQ